MDFFFGSRDVFVVIFSETVALISPLLHTTNMDQKTFPNSSLCFTLSLYFLYLKTVSLCNQQL